MSFAVSGGLRGSPGPSVTTLLGDESVAHVHRVAWDDLTALDLCRASKYELAQRLLIDAIEQRAAHALALIGRQSEGFFHQLLGRVGHEMIVNREAMERQPAESQHPP